MSTSEQNKLTLAYEGSVKRVWQCPWQADSLLFQFTDDYSVFDWGKMPDPIKNKGRALSVFGAYFFERLKDPLFWQALMAKPSERFCPEFFEAMSESRVLESWQKNGLPSHFQGLVDESGERLSLAKAATCPGIVYMQVARAKVQRPKDMLVLNQNIFHYPAPDRSAKARLIPLEVVFRFGMPAGSSLTERLKRDPAYAKLLGLKKVPEEGQIFERPVLEFYTKLEPKDRLLSVQEALLISGLEPEQFQDLACCAQLTALALFSIFTERGIELWDGKFEYILNEGNVFLADSIGPDELRLLYKGTHLSKEMIRQVYRGGSWEKSLKQAQKLAGERCTLDWKTICQSELKSNPEPLTPRLKATVNQLYGVLANSVSGEPLFNKEPDLDEFVSSAKANGL